MLKKEVFKVEDSNVAGLGSDLDKQCRETAAATEKAWAVAGKKVGLQAWRIEKFKVIKNDDALGGKFYDDDSYIVLRTYKAKDENGKETDKLKWSIHFWLGATSSQDEYGTAAYKTVELDDFLGGEPVQHREVSGHESNLFLSYFKDAGGIQLLKGGVESGFNHVEPEAFRPRLLHLKGRKNIRIVEVPLEFASMNEGDVFVMDAGLDIYQWQGKKAGKNEKARAGQFCRTLDDERRGKPEVHVYRQGDSDESEFFSRFPAFTSMDDVKISEDHGDDAEWEKTSTKSLFQLSDSSGSMQFELVAEGNVPKSLLNDNDVFVFDIGCEIYAWVGKGASKDEKKGAMNACHGYIKKKYPTMPNYPISVILQGGENEVFDNSFDRA